VGLDQVQLAKARFGPLPQRKEPMSTIEFFRSEDQRPLDADGHELPEHLNQFFKIPDGVAAALASIRTVAKCIGNDPPLCLQEELETAACELEQVINRLRNDPPDPAAYDAWLDRVNEINEGHDQDGRLTDDDVIIATGCAG
jgi:hypothetical protein